MSCGKKIYGASTITSSAMFPFRYLDANGCELCWDDVSLDVIAAALAADGEELTAVDTTPSSGVPSTLYQGNGTTPTPNPGTSYNMALDAAGNAYFCCNDAIYRLTPTGAVSVFAGVPGTANFLDGPAASALFNNPQAIALDPSDGSFVVADTSNGIVRRIKGGVVSTVPCSPPINSSTYNSSSPVGIAVDDSGNIYVSTNQQCVIKITPGGVSSLFAGTPGTNGNIGQNVLAASTDCNLNSPFGVAVDSDGNVFIADNSNSCVRVVAAKTGTLTPVGAVTSAFIYTYAGQLGSSNVPALGIGGQATAATLQTAKSVAVDGPGNVYLIDGESNSIALKVSRSSGIISVIDGVNNSSGSTSGKLSSPFAIITNDTGGLVLVNDQGNSRIQQITYPVCKPTKALVFTGFPFAEGDDVANVEKPNNGLKFYDGDSPPGSPSYIVTSSQAPITINSVVTKATLTLGGTYVFSGVANLQYSGATNATTYHNVTLQIYNSTASTTIRSQQVSILPTTVVGGDGPLGQITLRPVQVSVNPGDVIQLQIALDSGLTGGNLTVVDAGLGCLRIGD